VSSSIGRVIIDGEVFGFVRCYETPVPPVVHGRRVWATEADLDAHWRDSEWTPCACDPGAYVQGGIEGESYAPGEWPVMVCRSCCSIVDGFFPKDADEDDDLFARARRDGGG
jgi:hypothetical protein